MILRGKPEEEIPKVAEYKALKVFAKREVAYEEKETETLVQTAL
jgi:deoxyribodipyrimidine photo-lyase